MHDIVQKLIDHIDMITSNLSYLINEYLNERLQGIAWIGVENDFQENFLDLQEALQ